MSPNRRKDSSSLSKRHRMVKGTNDKNSAERQFGIGGVSTEDIISQQRAL